MAAGVYTITCTATGRVYVGSASKVGRRWAYHRYTLTVGTHHCLSLQADWRAYGAAAFSFSIFSECDPEALLPLEEATLRYYEGEGVTLYNTCRHPGSPAGYKHTAEARANMSEAQRGNTKAKGFQNFLGGHHSVETRSQISVKMIGVPKSPETRVRMSEAQKKAHARRREAKLSCLAS